MDDLSLSPFGLFASFPKAWANPYGGDFTAWAAPLLMVGLLLINAYFVALEACLGLPESTGVKDDKATSSSSWQRVHQKARLIRLLARFGVSFSALGLGVLLERWMPDALSAAMGPDPPAFVGLGFLLSFLALAVLYVGLGNDLPQRLALHAPVRVAHWTAPGAAVLTVVFYPLLLVSERLFQGAFRLIGLGHEPECDQRAMSGFDGNGATRGPRSIPDGEEAPESEMISSVLLLFDLVATQIMIPRTEMVCLPHSASVSDAMRVAAEEGHDRYPVYGENMDEIVGVLLIKDLVSHLACHPEATESPITDLCREALFVPGSLPCAQILTQLKERRTRLAIVLDEYGGTAGMLTLGDVLERIVGEVEEEEELEEPDDVVVINERTFSISGLVLSEDVEKLFGIDIEDELNDTVGGVVFSALGRAPQVGDEVTLQGWRFRVEALDGLRIDRLIVSAPTGARTELTGWPQRSAS